MESKPRTIKIFEDDDGYSPFEEWLDELAASDNGLLATVDARIGRVRRGLLGDCQPVGEGVSELKIGVGGGHRIYFGCRGDIVIMLLAGPKKTQTKNISKAKEYWRKEKDNA